MIKIELQGLIDWLKTKPADGTYRYTKPSGCLLQQYLTHLGAEGASVTPNYANFSDANGVPGNINISGELNFVAMGSNEALEIQSFGAALERALALQASGYQD